MNETHDPLEVELLEMLPREVSPELKRRIGRRLTDVASAAPRPRWGVALAGALAAACLAAILLGWRNESRNSSHQIVDGPGGSRFVQADDTPTLLAYRHALSRSPDELAALLDEHARFTLPPDTRGRQISAFTRLDELRSSMGEL
jgi:hypothetical protein